MPDDTKDPNELIDKLDEQTKAFISDVGDSPLCWDLICFYHNNPYTIHTAPSLAIFIGRRQDEIVTHAERLIGLKVLTKISQGENLLPIYAYEPSDFSHQAIAKILQLTEGQKKQMLGLAKLVKGRKK